MTGEGMSDGIILSAMAVIAVGFFCVGYLWGFKAGESKWLKFIDEKVVRVKEDCEPDNVKPGRR